MEREWGSEGGEGGGGGTTPLYFPCTRPVASTPPCYIIHSGTSAWGRWRRRFFGAGLAPADHGADR